MLLIVCNFFFYYNTMRCLQSHYRVSTESLQSLYSLLQTLYRLSTDSLQTLYRLSTAYYRLSTAYYGLSTDSLHSTMALYRLSTASTDSLQTLYSHTAAVLQQCCSSAVQNIEVTTGTTALQALLRHCCGTAAAPLRQTGVC